MTHTCQQHQPTAACYQRCRCRCADCKRAQSRYAKQRRIRTAHGINTLVDATPAREHVEKLMRMGMSHGTIALQAGMPNSGLQALLGLKSNGPRVRRIHRRTSARILAVTYTSQVGATRIDATAAKRRLQDLALRGFSAKELQELCGIERHSISQIRCGVRRYVVVDTDRTIADLHRRLEGTVPTLTLPAGQKYIITLARRYGYAPLAAWDDIANPHERAKGVAA